MATTKRAINVTLPHHMIDSLDRMVEETQLSRSSVLTMLLSEKFPKKDDANKGEVK